MRLTNGAEDNVWHYYSVLIKSEGQAGAVASPQTPSPDSRGSGPKKPWWKFWW